MTAEERNEAIIDYFTKVLCVAITTSEEMYKTLDDYEKAKEILDVLIPHKYDGFRGVVMTAMGGFFLDNKYNPFKDFYGCNPRPVFEHGIFYVLEAFRIPSGKSAPLNVAKGIKKLNDQWVAGKKKNSQAAAQAVIDYIQLLMKANKSAYSQLVHYFFMRLDRYADSVRSIEIECIDSEIDSKNILANKLIEFTLNYPEAGTVPQTVIGKLIRYTVEREGKYVKGENESVFGTNTTSKKPADIWIENELGEILALYEITAKKIDYKRLDDSVHAIKQIDVPENSEIYFICRMPIDINPLALEDGVNTLCYKNQWFNFLDIGYFILSSIALLTADELNNYFSEINEFIDAVNRPKMTKDGWNVIFSQPR